MTNRTDVYRALTPFGGVEVDFPEEAGVLFDGPDAAVQYLLSVIGDNTNKQGQVMSVGNLEPHDFFYFCQPAGSGVTIIAPADTFEDEEQKQEQGDYAMGTTPMPELAPVMDDARPSVLSLRQELRDTRGVMPRLSIVARMVALFALASLPAANDEAQTPAIKKSLNRRQKENNAAIAALRAIRAGTADPQDANIKDALKGYSGSGGGLMSAEGLSGSPTEYYTPKPVAKAMWGLLEGLGFSGGKVLDPSAGMGIFSQTKPDNVAIEQIEIDPVSAEINGILNNGETVSTKTSSFEEVAANTDDESFDAVMTNVPFGEHAMRGAAWKKDPRYQKASLTDYFVLRAIEKVRPGGYAVLLVAHGVVSGKGGKAIKLRTAVSLKAEFIGAYRLPNQVFDEAGADTISDVVVFRKHGREQVEKIEELRQQSAGLLTQALVLWPEFLEGNYFKGEGRRFQIGESQMGMGKYGEVEKVVHGGDIASVGALIRPFDKSGRIDWALLETVETAPIVYSEGDTIYAGGASLRFMDGKLVPVKGGVGNEDLEAIALLSKMSTPMDAIRQGVTLEQAKRVLENETMQGRQDNLPRWSVMATRSAVDSEAFEAILSGLCVQAIDGERESGGEPQNYSALYPELSAVIARTWKRSKALSGERGMIGDALKSVGKARNKTGFTPWWSGSVAVVLDEVMLPGESYDKARQDFEAGDEYVPVSVMMQGNSGFDPLNDDGWCISPDGTGVMHPRDFFVGNYGDFLRRTQADIDASQDPAVKEKLMRQRELAKQRISSINLGKMKFTLGSQYVSMDEKLQFITEYITQSIALTTNAGGGRAFSYTGRRNSNDMSGADFLQYKAITRLVTYLNNGTITSGTATGEKSNNDQEAAILEAIKSLVDRSNSQFDSWCKASDIGERVNARMNDPDVIRFNEEPDYAPVEISGWNPERKPHDYQNATMRRFGKRFSGIVGLDVGLGKTLTALATVQYVQSLGIKKRTVFVVPNSVLSNWRKETQMAYQSTSDCLFVGLRENKGKMKYSPSSVDEDLAAIVSGKYAKIFMTYENLEKIPLRDQTLEAYKDYLMSNDDSFSKAAVEGESKKKKSEQLGEEAVLAKTLTNKKASFAVPYFEDMGVDSIVIDEAHCFPAGTLVDGVPIELLKIGDMVRSLNHLTGAIELKRITDVMSKQVTALVRVHLENGQSIVCTPEHEFYTVQNGYVAVEFLNKCDTLVFTDSKIEENEQSHLPALPTNIFRNSTPAMEGEDWGDHLLHSSLLPREPHQEDSHFQALCAVRDSVRVESHAKLEGSDRQDGNILLHSVVHDIEHTPEFSKNEGVAGKPGKGGSASCNSGAQGKLAANPGIGGEKPTDPDCQRDAQGKENCRAGRQWEATLTGASIDGKCSCMDGGVCGADEYETGQRIPAMLQARLGKFGAENGGGDRRPLAFQSADASQRSQERGLLKFVGVERIEVLQSGSDSGYGGLCKDGLVYDITVDENHNFFAEGVLVHNCFKNSKNFSTTEDAGGFKQTKFVANPATSGRGKAMQAKCWYLRGITPSGDGVMALTATPVTNSPLEIYSMLALAVGEKEVNAMCGTTGANSFMSNFCAVEDRDEDNIIGKPVSVRVLSGIQNLELLQRVLGASSVIETVETVEKRGTVIEVPDYQETSVGVELPRSDIDVLMAMKAHYEDLIKTIKSGGKDSLSPAEVVMASPFNLIRRMTKLITDPDLSKGEFSFQFSPSDAAAVSKAVEGFNKLKKTEERKDYELAEGVDPSSFKSRTIIDEETGGETVVYLVPVLARIEGSTLFVPGTDYKTHDAMMALVVKAGVVLSAKPSPKVAAMLENVKTENANARWPIPKQIIFCDELALHHKLKLMVASETGISPGKIAIVNAASVDPSSLLDVQNGFNNDGADDSEEPNRYQIIIANKKAEVGINLQKGTQAIHHLTIGWTPDSIHQRNGRGVRQGNKIDTPIMIYHYDANGTFDSYKRRLVGIKGDWIGKVMDPTVNQVDIEGDMTREQYESLAASVGDADAMSRIQEQTAESNRKKMRQSNMIAQTNAVSTMASTKKWLERYSNDRGGFGAWIASKQSIIVGMQTQINGLQERAGKTQSAAMSARYGKQIAEITEKIAIARAVINGADTSRAWNANDYAGTDAANNWAKEVKLNTRMGEEAENAFLLREGQGYSRETLDEMKSGTGSLVGGRLIAQGDLVELEDGRRGIVKNNDYGRSLAKVVLLQGEFGLDRMVITEVRIERHGSLGTAERIALLKLLAADCDSAIDRKIGHGLWTENTEIRGAMSRASPSDWLTSELYFMAPLFPMQVPDGWPSSWDDVRQAQNSLIETRKAAYSSRTENRFIDMRNMGEDTNTGSERYAAISRWMEANARRVTAEQMGRLNSIYASAEGAKAVAQALAGSKTMAEFPLAFIREAMSILPWLEVAEKSAESALTLSKMLQMDFRVYTAALTSLDDGSEPYPAPFSPYQDSVMKGAILATIEKSGLPKGLAAQFDADGRYTRFGVLMSGLGMAEMTALLAVSLGSVVRSDGGITLGGEFAAKARQEMKLGASAMPYMTPNAVEDVLSHSFKDVYLAYEAFKSGQLVAQSSLDVDALLAGLVAEIDGVAFAVLGTSPYVKARDKYTGSVTMQGGTWIKVSTTYGGSAQKRVSEKGSGLEGRIFDGSTKAWVISMYPVKFSDNKPVASVEDFCKLFGVDIKKFNKGA